MPIDRSQAEDFKHIIIISGKCPSKILEGGSQKVETPPTPPPSRPSPIELIYIPIDRSQPHDSDYKIKKRLIVDVQKLQELAPPAYRLTFNLAGLLTYENKVHLKEPIAPFNSKKLNHAGHELRPLVPFYPQVPVIQVMLGQLGLVTSQAMLSQWRYVVVGATVAAAVLTPSTDPFTQVGL